MTERETRPDFIGHYSQFQSSEAWPSPDPHSDERFSLGAPLGSSLGLKRLGVHHELLPPGRRTSPPHAHSHDEEFVFVLAGHPDVWIDGHLHRLTPGDAVAFRPEPEFRTRSSTIRGTPFASWSSAMPTIQRTRVFIL